MADNVVVIRYGIGASKAYEVLSDLKTLGGGNDVRSAGLVEVGPDGVPSIKDGFDNEGGSGGAVGGLIGMVIGILGGPLGMLLGLGTGGLIGAASDASQDDDYTGVVSGIVKNLNPGDTAVIAHVDENDPTTLDKLALESGGFLDRVPAEDLLNDLYAAEDQAEAEEKQEKQAEKAERKQEKAEEKAAKKAARQDKVDTKLDSIKSNGSAQDAAAAASSS